MWLWVLAAGLFALAALLFFLLYRRAKMALEYANNPANTLTIDGIAALLSELEATGEIIVERLEVKQREVEQLVQLLDTKLALLQAKLALKAEPEQNTVVVNNERNEEQVQTAQSSLGEKPQLVQYWQQQGFNPVEIAQSTGLKLDEVRLILNLLRSHNIS